MAENILKLIEAYNAKSITLGELYGKLLQLQIIRDDLFEKTLLSIAGAHTSFLLLTYQNSKINP